MSLNNRHDVVIVGAGPGGSAAGYYLARRGLKVLLLDKADFPRDKTCGDGLTPRALAVLKSIGLMDELEQLGCRINGMAVYAPDGRAVIAPFPKREDGINYSLIVPRLKLDNLIHQKALSGGAHFESGVHVTNIVRGINGVLVKGERNGQNVEFQGKVAIVATGANIGLLRNIGLLKRKPQLLTANRTYYEGLHNLSSDTIQIRFEGVPLPGYGWVFPISATAANVGVIFHPAISTSRRISTSRAAFEAFLQVPALKKILGGAERVGAIKGYPVYTDFGYTATFAHRVLLVGEAAGLVNPLTADGTDFALLSGKIAAAHIARMFATGDFSRPRFAEYDQALRQRFERLFWLCRQGRNWLDSPLLFNQMMRGASAMPVFNKLMVEILLGG